MIYLDTSAAMKLVRPERHSVELSTWLRDQRSGTFLSSVLVEIELIRATRRIAPDRIAVASEVLRGIGTITLSPSIVARAASLDDPFLRSLDAIHLATAQHLAHRTGEAIEAFVAYDDRLLGAARAAGLATASPGTR